MRQIILTTLFAVAMVAEAVIGRRLGKTVYRLNDTVANFGNSVLRTTSEFLVDGFLVGLYIAIYSKTPLRIPVEPWSWVVGFLIVDFVYYWQHRLSHRVNLLWATHIVHHQSEEFNFSVSFRISATQNLVRGCSNLPIALLGLHPVVFLAADMVSRLEMIWYHTRVIGDLGPLEWILMTPSNHRVHHGCNREYIDHNFGGALMIWDQIFGTFKREEQEPVYGLARPLPSWNPFWAHIHVFVDLARTSMSLPRWRDKLRVWFAPPEWVPGRGLVGYEVMGDVTRRQKYDPPVERGVLVYAVAHALSVQLLWAIFVYFFRMAGTPEKITFVLFMACSVVSLGGLFDGKAWTVWSEPARLIATPLAVLAYLGAERLGFPALLALCAAAALSLAWFVAVRMRAAPAGGRGIALARARILGSAR